MATQPIVTKNLVSQMISLLDTLYHWGVRDSHALCDEGAAREFLESHSETNVYGFLTDACPISALEWQLRLIQQARLTSMFGSMYQYFLRMGRFSANYLSVFIPLAQRWYNRGVQDYYDNQGAADYAVFEDSKRTSWSERGLRKYNNREAVETIQLDCFELQRRDAAYLEAHADDYKSRKLALREQHYLWFIRSVGLALAKKEN